MRVIRVMALAVGLACAAACQTPEELDGDDIEGGMGWDDLMAHRSDQSEMIIATDLADAVQELPVEVQDKPSLARLAIGRALRNPEPYEGGVFGLVGSAKIFIATTDRVPDETRLYWVLVKVLSEKYGCFMTQKQNVGETVHVRCRDKRQIVFWKTRGAGWQAFQARQFDRDGFEIMVRARRIVRISDRKVL